MKRWKIVAACIAVACATAAVVITVQAQTLPIIKTVAWVQSDAVTAKVTGYTVQLDNAAPVSVGPCTPDPTQCEAPVTFTTVGPHTIKVIASNSFGAGAVGTLSVNVVVPGQPTGITIK